MWVVKGALYVHVSTSCNVRGGVTGQQMMESWAESAKQP